MSIERSRMPYLASGPWEWLYECLRRACEKLSGSHDLGHRVSDVARGAIPYPRIVFVSDSVNQLKRFGEEVFVVDLAGDSEPET